VEIMRGESARHGAARMIATVTSAAQLSILNCAHAEFLRQEAATIWQWAGEIGLARME
jgi:hypothetical protein